MSSIIWDYTTLDSALADSLMEGKKEQRRLRFIYVYAT